VTIERNDNLTARSRPGKVSGPTEPAVDPAHSGRQLPRHVHLEKSGGVVVLSFDADEAITSETIEAIGRSLFDANDAERLIVLVVNLEGVRTLSSAALGKLIGLKKRIRADGGEFRLCGLHPELLEVFQLTHLDRVFQIDAGG
jgi:anti-sigma B factor antagonist